MRLLIIPSHIVSYEMLIFLECCCWMARNVTSIYSYVVMCPDVFSAVAACFFCSVRCERARARHQGSLDGYCLFVCLFVG